MTAAGLQPDGSSSSSLTNMTPSITSLAIYPFHGTMIVGRFQMKRLQSAQVTKP
jgi:hypothetical protein